MGVHIVPMCIGTKGNVIMRLYIQRVDYEVIIQHINKYTTETFLASFIIYQLIKASSKNDDDDIEWKLDESNRRLKNYDEEIITLVFSLLLIFNTRCIR